MLKQILAAAIAMPMWNGAAMAQTAASQPVAPQRAAATCPLPAVADTVALQDVPGTNLKTVPVSINGTKKQFLLDMSTNLSEVSKQAVAQLGLPDVRNAPSDYMNLAPGVDTYKEQTGHANFNMNVTVQAAFENVKGSRGAEAYRPHVRIASFTLGDATGHNLMFAIAKDEEMGKAASKPYDGLMTGDFFKQYDVELDFYRNTLTYLTPTSCTDPEQVVYWPHAAVAIIPTTRLDGKIQVQVAVQGHSIPAVIDTSSPNSVMRRDIAELILGLKADTPEMMPDGEVRDGEGMRVYRHNFSQISFAGGVTAYNVPALIQSGGMVRNPARTPILGSRAQFSTTPDIPALTLGMDVLSQLHLYLATAQQLLYVTSAQ